MSQRQTKEKDGNDNMNDQETSQDLHRHGSKNRSAGVLVQPSDVSESAQMSPSSTVSAHDEAIATMNSKIHELRIADSLANGEPSVQDNSPTTDPEKQTSTAENIYDPFDGQRVGILVSESHNKAEDELWKHLTHIRTLQSEIAKMHAHMEGLGEGERQQMDDERPDVDEELKAAKFARLGDRFNGRKEAIDSIMTKLDTLSQAINDFHASRAPLFQFEKKASTDTDIQETQLADRTKSERRKHRSGSRASVPPTQQDVKEDHRETEV